MGWQYCSLLGNILAFRIWLLPKLGKLESSSIRFGPFPPYSSLVHRHTQPFNTPNHSTHHCSAQPAYITPFLFQTSNLSNHVYFHQFTRLSSNPLWFKWRTRLHYARFTSSIHTWRVPIPTSPGCSSIRDPWYFSWSSAGPVSSWSLDATNDSFRPTWAGHGRLQIPTPYSGAHGQLPKVTWTWRRLSGLYGVTVTLSYAWWAVQQDGGGADEQADGSGRDGW